MKKYFYFLMMAVAGFAFIACEDVPEPYGINLITSSSQADVILSETFATSLGKFTSQTTDGEGAWAIDYSTAKAAGYDNNTKITTAGTYYLVSPKIDLTGIDAAHVTFDYILRYLRNAEDQRVLISSDYAGDAATATWTALPVKLVEGSDWSTFANADVDIPAEFLGKVVNIALYYSCGSSNSSTWEVKNLKVLKGKASGSDNPDIPTDAIEVTCAEAAAIANELADGATSSETYAITGYITEVVGAVSRNQQTFWMADTPDGGRVFEAYWADLPEGVTQFTKGTKVKIVGQIMKYVNNNTGAVTPEIKNATVIILEEGGDTPTPTGIEVTCAEAAAIANELADGATSADTYTVTGYITEVVGTVSRNQQTFWMADTQDGGRVFEAYWADLPEGVTQFTKGAKVKITGQIMKYVNSSTGAVTPEIKNASVTILEEGGGGTPTPTGIEVTCAEAVAIANELANGATSADTYTVTGYITEVVGTVSRNQQTFWMADTPDGGRVFEAYWADLPEGVTQFTKGAKVKITGQIMKYVNSSTGAVTPEIKNASVTILEDGGGTPTPDPGTGVSLDDFTNGDFEAWDNDSQPTGWTSVASNATLAKSTEAHGGDYAVVVKGAAGNKRMAYQEMSLEAGTYTISCYAKAATSAAGKIRMGYAKLTNGVVADTQNDYVYGDKTDVAAGEWQQVSYQFTLDAPTAVSLLLMNSKDAGKDVLIDDYTIVKN